MRIIHFADLHIGSKFNRLPEELQKELNTELRNRFSDIIDYAKKQGIDTILMSGDIFDKNAVPLKDKRFFYGAIRSNPDIDFYYIKGNHDSTSRYAEKCANLHEFDGLKSYVKGDVRIIGYELQRGDNAELYEHAPFPRDKFNVMLLHGDIDNANDHNHIDLKRLQGMNIDYFALGHIHKRGSGMIGLAKYAYPGCVMGRGFDECGEKGFLVLDTEKNDTEFVPLLGTLFERIEIKANGIQGEAELKSAVSSALGEKRHDLITEVKIIGKASFDVDAEDLKRSFEGKRLCLLVKNEAKQALLFKRREQENSLRSLFVNSVLERNDLDDDTKEKVIEYGLSRLLREEG